MKKDFKIKSSILQQQSMHTTKENIKLWTLESISLSFMI